MTTPTQTRQPTAALARGALIIVCASSLVGAQTRGPNAGANCQDGLHPVAPRRGPRARGTVHGAALVGNLEGDSPDRCVSVYLPPSYESSPGRRYPVVYILHGYTDDDQHWFGWKRHFVNVPQGMEKALAAGTSKEMILVMANAYTVWQGSMYSSSITTGDWETFIAEDLVSYIDGRYRTIAKRESRGLAGHSMGGYGAIRIGMKRPDVFSSDYVMSPCCMPAVMTVDSVRAAMIEAVTDFSQAASVPFPTRAMLAEAAA